MRCIEDMIARKYALEDGDTFNILMKSCETAVNEKFNKKIAVFKFNIDKGILPFNEKAKSQRLSTNSFKWLFSGKLKIVKGKTAMKAYFHQDDDGMAFIYYAETAGKAKMQVQQENCEDYTDIRVRREKWADKYKKMSDIPIKELLKHGWSWDCFECGALLNEEDLIEKEAMIEDNTIYCKKCYKKLGEK